MGKAQSHVTVIERRAGGRAQDQRGRERLGDGDYDSENIDEKGARERWGRVYLVEREIGQGKRYFN